MESESESFERISILDKRDLLRSDRVPRKGHIEWVKWHYSNFIESMKLFL